MNATCIEYTETRAVVRLEPGWLGRFFGQKPMLIELVRVRLPGREDVAGSFMFSEWLAPGSNRSISSLPYGYLIMDALDFHPIPT